MRLDHWQKVKAIFNSALAIENDLREEYLARACEGDDDLLRNYPADR